jgi:tetratricopeptide (TPR) repeat protein
MPSTINGVGTHYVGKKNLERNFGVCDQCHYHGELLSYDTRLWFVFLFIPIIPLSRKRILDYCPKCTAHRAVPYSEWYQAGEEVITESEKEFTDNPNNSEAAIKYHSALDCWGKNEEAANLTEQMNRHFKHDFDVQMYLGSWFEQKGDSKRADECFEKALRIDPNNPDAKRAVAIGYIVNDEIEKAEELLAYMKKPGKDQDLGTLFMLGNAYQQKGLHDQALSIFKIICRDFPDTARKDKNFRKSVSKSEKMCPAQQTILPPPPFNWAKVIIPVAIVALATIIFQTNSYLKKHRHLYVVNGLPVKTSIKLPGKQAINISPNSINRSIRISEGEFKVTITKPGGSETLEVAVRDNIWNRFFGDNAFVINIDGGAIIMKAECIYTDKAKATGKNRYQLYIMPQFMKFRGIDYAFEEFPKTVELSSSNSEKIKTQLSVLKIKPARALSSLEKDLKISELLSYAEAHLSVASSEQLLDQYQLLLIKHKQASRGLKFLKARLGKRPVDMDWHRCYQNLAETMHKNLIPEYDRLLKQNPKSSALLYLRGRIDNDNRKALKYYDRAIAIDVNNKFPQFAKVFALANMGELKKAARLGSELIKKFPDSSKMFNFNFCLQLASGNYKSIKKEAEIKLQKKPLDWQAVVDLVSVETALNQQKQARQVIKNYKDALKKKYPSFKNFSKSVKLYLAYIQNDLKSCEKLGSSKNKALSYYLLLEQLKISQAAKVVLKLPEKKINGYLCLEMFIGESCLGNKSKAAEWLKKAKQKFASSNDKMDAEILELLEGKNADPVDRVKRLSIENFPNKALICLSMADIYPLNSKELTRLASNLNILIVRPHYFINKVVARSK